MKELKRIERREDGDIMFDSDIVKLIDAKCKEFVKSLCDNVVSEYDLPDVEFIVHSSISTEFTYKRVCHNLEYAKRTRGRGK